MTPEQAGIRALGEVTTRCKCVWKTDMNRNLERGWVGLSKAPPIPKSPLLGYEAKNLWVTANGDAFRDHLRHVAIRQGFNWMFKVVTDVDMMDAWLSKNVDKVHDPDISIKRKQKHGADMEVYISLTELVEPPELLILRLGVKVTRNSATPEALLETLQHREHLGKMTWIVDQPIYRLQEGHIAYDDRLGEYLTDWKHITLEDKGATGTKTVKTTAPLSSGMPSLSELHAKAQKRKGDDK